MSPSFDDIVHSGTCILGVSPMRRRAFDVAKYF